MEASDVHGNPKESQEIILGTSTGIVKGSTIRKKSDDENRWDVTQLNELVGAPWEPIPGNPNAEIRTRTYFP